MGEGGPPQLPDKRNITQAGVAGVILGMLGIALFVGLWWLLGALNVSIIIRLVVSICMPPAIISTIVGVYMLTIRPKQQNIE